MPPPVIRLKLGFYSALRRHLFKRGSKEEEVAFLYLTSSNGADVFDVTAHDLIGSEGFEHRSAYHFELSETTQARVIKRAHDLKACIAEIHCHRFQDRARFSPSDIAGLKEFVPHVRWRLKGRPYFALVFAGRNFDGLAWLTNAEHPGIIALEVDGEIVAPTGLTAEEWEIRTDA